MAVTVTTKQRSDEVWGRRRVGIYTVTLDNSYTTGGEAFDPKAFGYVGTPQFVELNPRYSAGATGPITRNFLYDPVNKKIVVLINATGVEQANAGDVSGCVLDIVVFGD